MPENIYNKKDKINIKNECNKDIINKNFAIKFKIFIEKKMKKKCKKIQNNKICITNQFYRI